MHHRDFRVFRLRGDLVQAINIGGEGEVEEKKVKGDICLNIVSRTRHSFHFFI